MNNITVINAIKTEAALDKHICIFPQSYNLSAKPTFMTPYPNFIKLYKRHYEQKYR